MKSFLGALDRVPGPHPVVFVAVGFPPEPLTAALHQAAALSRGPLGGQAVYPLQGPWQQYTAHLPALAYLSGTQATATIVPVGPQTSKAELTAAFGRVARSAPKAVPAHRSGHHS